MPQQMSVHMRAPHSSGDACRALGDPGGAEALYQASADCLRGAADSEDCGVEAGQALSITLSKLGDLAYVQGVSESQPPTVHEWLRW